MNLPAACIRRPVMTTLLTAAICVFGVMAYTLLPVSDLPNVDFPTIVVSASLPGATPETMASAVATPLEQQFSTIAGIDSMVSTSSLGTTTITLQFTLDRNIDAAAQDVQSSIAAVQRLLPTSMPAPPSFRKTNPADQPVLYLALSSATLPLSMVDEFAETRLAQRISTVDGVAQVQVFGSQKYALRVQLDPRALAARGIPLSDVQNALAAHNVNLPTGVLDGNHQAMTIVATGQLAHAADFGQIVVAYRNGAPVRLAELARVIDSVQDNRVASWFSSGHGLNRTILLAVQRQPGTNTVEVVQRVRALLPAFNDQLPASVSLEVWRTNPSPCGSRSTTCSSRSCSRSRWSCWSSSFSCGEASPRRSSPAWRSRSRCWARLSRCTFLAIRSTIFRCWRSRCRSASWWTTPSSCSRTSSATSRPACPCVRRPSRARPRSASPSCR